MKTSKIKNQKRILLVDDDLCILQPLAAYLEANGYVVVQEQEGNSALATYRKKGPWHFVVSDFNFIPGPSIRNGAMLAAKILSLEPQQKLVIHSGDISKVFKALANLRESGQLKLSVEVPVLEKPYHLHELKELMEKLTA